MSDFGADGPAAAAVVGAAALEAGLLPAGQAAVIEESSYRGRPRKRIVVQIPLDRYYARRELSRDEETNKLLYDVAGAYMALAAQARLTGTAAAQSYVRVDHGHDDGGEAAHAALQRLIRAQQAIGPTHAAVLRWVCLEGGSADAWAKSRGYMRGGTGLAFLIDALTCLAQHWGRL